LNLEFLEEEVIPPSATPPPPPPPPPAPSTVLEIVDDEEEIEETEQVIEEPDEETVVEAPPPPEEEETDEIFTIVEDMPTFPGGETALFKFLANEIKYPQMAVDAGISGTVYVNFVVDKDGKVKNAKIARGIHAACDKEALRVVNSMPAWKPGKQRGKPVKVSYNLPIKFTLQ
jgi:protein TonB